MSESDPEPVMLARHAMATRFEIVLHGRNPISLRAAGEEALDEIERLENKIRTLAELAVNRQEPDFISGQVDQVAGSMLETEKTMNELQFATGLAPLDEEIPELVFPKQINNIS